MKDTLVSIRMPSSMLSSLKRIAEEEHFMDVSELIRSIVRKNWVKHTNPEMFELKKLREGIQSEVLRKGRERVRDEVNRELEKIKSELKEGGALSR